MMRDKIKNPFFVFYGLLILWVALYTSYKPTRGSRAADLPFMRENVLPKFKAKDAPHFYNLRTGVDDVGEVPYFYMASKLVILPKGSLKMENADLVAFALAHEDGHNNPLATFWVLSIMLFYFVKEMIVILIGRAKASTGVVLVSLWLFYASYSFIVELGADRYAQSKLKDPSTCTRAMDRLNKMEKHFRFQDLIHVVPPVEVRRLICEL